VKTGSKIVIIGLGMSGKAAGVYLAEKGHELIGVDRDPQPCEFEVLSETAPVDLKGAELVVKSPGISPTHPWIRAAAEKEIPILGEIDLALQELRKIEKTLFAITGSNGKTTTTLLVTHLLHMAGKKAIAAGNVGIPLISQLDKDVDIFVVELSSFQLENIVSQPVFSAAVILNITPNHLDRHGSLLAYAKAKFRLQSCLKAKSPLFIKQAVLNQFDKLLLPQTKPFVLGSYKKKVETILSLGYTRDKSQLYSHDLENFCAAYALTQGIGIPEDILREGMVTFKKPPHRIEFVREVGGVSYINDSKATSMEAVKKAIQALSGEVILIAGGMEKGGSFYEWVPIFRKKVVLVLAIGVAAKRIHREIGRVIDVEVISSLEVGVKRAHMLAKTGQTVLLSPGCSSFDQFKNFQHRGEIFKQLVFAIKD